MLSIIGQLATTLSDAQNALARLGELGELLDDQIQLQGEESVIEAARKACVLTLNDFQRESYRKLTYGERTVFKQTVGISENVVELLVAANALSAGYMPADIDKAKEAIVLRLSLITQHIANLCTELGVDFGAVAQRSLATGGKP